MASFLEYLQVFLFGAAVYSILEVLFRGFTHWTMFIAGGLCFSILYYAFTKFKFPLWKNCIIGAAVITIVEFVFGCVFNLALGWNVWDYSHYPLDFMGQVCLFYTLLWFLLSVPIIWLTRGLKKRIYH